MSRSPSSSQRCFSLLVFILTIVETNSSLCSSSSFHCPPFNSSPPFPFSTSPGCGHPNFQIQCSSPRATISIKNLTFSLLHYSSTLTLSPHLDSNQNNCSSLRFTLQSLRLVLLPPLSPPSLLSSNSPELQSLSSRLQTPKEPGSDPPPMRVNPRVLIRARLPRQGDLLSFLQDFLTRFGFEVEWDESQDPYFSKCTDCRVKNGLCGFNTTHPNQDFICFSSQPESTTTKSQCYASSSH